MVSLSTLKFIYENSSKFQAEVVKPISCITDARDEQFLFSKAHFNVAGHICCICVICSLALYW